jgi:hypothetical protein
MTFKERFELIKQILGKWFYALLAADAAFIAIVIYLLFYS